MTKIIVGLATGILLFISAIIYLQLSIWFLWEMAPESSIRFAVDKNHSASEKIVHFVNLITVSELTNVSKHASKFSYSIGNGSATFIAVPNNLFQSGPLRDSLKNEGWQVNRYGFILIANKGAEPYPSTRNGATWRALKDIINPESYLNPVLIGRAIEGTLPYLSESVYIQSKIIPSKKDQKAQFQVSLSSNNNATFTADFLPDEVTENRLQVSLQSQLLNKADQRIVRLWNEKVSEMMNLNSPINVQELAKSHENITLIIDSEESSIAVQKSPLIFINYIKNIIEEEVSQANPERRAFSLPDSTIGFELIPAGPSNVFQDSDTPNCQFATWQIGNELASTEASSQSIWLCVNNNRAAIGTSQEVTMQAIQSIFNEGTTWSIALGANHLPDSLQYINSLEAAGTISDVNIRAEIRE